MNIQSMARVLPFLLVFGCAKNPADDVPAASVTAAKSAVTNTAPKSEPEAGAAKTFAFDNANGTVTFVGSKVTGKHEGGFRKFSGELTVAGGQIADTGNKVVIDTRSIWSDNERLTGHLKSPDFFDVAKYPEATFTTTSVKQSPGGATVTGDLSLHGITKSISFPAKINVTDARVDVTAEFFINRFDFNMQYPGKADDLIRKEVVLKLDVKAVPAKGL
jgi:polyisoprenoid-binding protein YceI